MTKGASNVAEVSKTDESFELKVLSLVSSVYLKTIASVTRHASRAEC